MRARNSLLTSMRKDEDELAGSRPEVVPRMPPFAEKANTEANEKQKVIKDGIFTTPTPTPNEDATWFERAVLEVRNFRPGPLPTPRKYIFDVTSVGQRKYVFDVTSVGDRTQKSVFPRCRRYPASLIRMMEPPLSLVIDSVA